jgi:hypothetical protein
MGDSYDEIGYCDNIDLNSVGLLQQSVITRSIAVRDLKEKQIGRMTITLELSDDKEYIAYKT